MRTSRNAVLFDIYRNDSFSTKNSLISFIFYTDLRTDKILYNVRIDVFSFINICNTLATGTSNTNTITDLQCVLKC